MRTSNSRESIRGDAPLRPERYRIQTLALPPRAPRARVPICLLYLAEHATGIPPAQASILESLAPEWIEPQVLLVTDDAAEFPRLQSAFQIRRLPCLVFFRPWPSLSRTSLNPPASLPTYCVMEDETILQSLIEPANQARNLLQLFASATSEELETTLRTRRFRMLVWQASARAGVPIPYLQDLQVRFGSPTSQQEFSFDVRGWPQGNVIPLGA